MATTAAVENAVQARHEEIIGQPPRLRPIDREAAAESVLESTGRLAGGLGSAPGARPPLDAIPDIFFTMSRVPALWNRLIDVTGALQGPDSGLSARDRKLAILRTAWLCQAPYIFGEHVHQSRRMGFSSEEIELVIEGSAAPGWDPHEQAILRAAEELHERAMIGDETWQQLASRLDEAQLIELLVLIGQFTATAFLQNALRLRLQPKNKGLSAR